MAISARASSGVIENRTPSWRVTSSAITRQYHSVLFSSLWPISAWITFFGTPCCTKCIANESLNVLVHNEVTITTYGRALKLVLRTPQLLVVILVVLTEREFRFSLLISQLMAKAIPVRGAKFKKPAFERAFCFLTLSFQPDRLL